jgi:hypothetical protein
VTAGKGEWRRDIRRRPRIGFRLMGAISLGLVASGRTSSQGLLGPAFGKNGPAHRLEAFKALGGSRDRSLDREIITQPREDERVAAGRKRKVRIHRLGDDHFAILIQRRNLKIIGVAADMP